MRKILVALAGALTLAAGTAAPQISAAQPVKVVVGPHNTRVVVGKHHWRGRYYKYRQWRCHWNNGRKVCAYRYWGPVAARYYWRGRHWEHRSWNCHWRHGRKVCAYRYW